MILSDALMRIKFKIGSTDDINSKAINPLITTSNLLYELNAQTNKYAIKTKGIQDVFSTSVSMNDQFINAPSLALRSGAYRFALMIVRGWIQPLDIRGQADVSSIYRVSPLRGMSSWLTVIQEGNSQRLFFYPMNGVSYNTTTLVGNITSTDTTITVASTASFIATGGRITIDSEKILYEYKDATNFYGCVRGLEMTTATTHANGATIKENNLIINYSRLPIQQTITDTPSVTALATELEVVEDHIEGLCDVVAYNLLIKIDPSRATLYKIDGDALFEQYRLDIGKGHGKNRPGVNVREPFMAENGMPFGGNRY
jgi:hypothetical protein